MTRPVDVDGTPLHAGDLVESRWSAPGHWGAGARKPVVRIKGAPSGWFVSDGGQVVASAFRLVPETRQERIVRRSHERPQVVQVRYSAHSRPFRARIRPNWGVVIAGRMHWFAPGFSHADVVGLAIEDATRGPLAEWGIPDDGTWTVL